MSTEEILIQEKSTVVVNGKSYQIGKLSISQTWKLGKLIASSLMSGQGKLKQLQEKTSKSTSNADDLMGILDLLSEADLLKFFSIILKDDNLTDIELESAVEIVAVICEQNKLLQVKKNFQRIMTAITGMLESKKAD